VKDETNAGKSSKLISRLYQIPYTKIKTIKKWLKELKEWMNTTENIWNITYQYQRSLRSLSLSFYSNFQNHSWVINNHNLQPILQVPL